MLAIIDYDAGNLTSVQLAFEAVDVPVVVTRDPRVILGADRVVFPGVGAAGAAMASLRRLGLCDVVREAAGRGRPFLGICLGTQIILTHSEEDNGVETLDMIPGGTRLFHAPHALCKIPQMGWNTVRFTTEHRILAGIEDGSEFYFVHSYYPAPADESVVLGRTEYAGIGFASVLASKNIVATQFHPEKSGRIGLRLLANFAAWDGAPC